MSDEQKRESDIIRAALERESVTKKGKGSQVGYGADEQKTPIEPSRGEEPREEIIEVQEGHLHARLLQGLQQEQLQKKF